MALIRYEPWNVMERLHRQIDQIFGDSFATPAASGEGTATWAPSVDVHEEPDKFVVRADLPGVEAKDIHVTAENGTLSISGKRHFERRESDQGFSRLERIEGSFLRRFTLPDNVQTDAIRARQDNGVLEVTIPKTPVAEPKRISVETH